MIEWDSRHGKILKDFVQKLNIEKIRWFILRGYVGLPDSNLAKDVDIMVEPGKEKVASHLLQTTFREAGLKYFYPVVYGHAHCYLGMNPDTHFSIHIDLIEGYVSKGYEVVTFEEMYEHTCSYHDMVVLDDVMNGVMLLVYKIFGYQKAKLKQSYCDDIKKTFMEQTEEFSLIVKRLFGDILSKKILDCIRSNDFDKIVRLEAEITKRLKVYTVKQRPFRTLAYRMEFLIQKIGRIVFNYNKYAKTFAVLAPDGTGKTTFLDTLKELMSFYYVNDENDNRFHVYHFRPEILPNLGSVGEKVGVMKQDTDFTNPHRSKPANCLSSLLRISYYTLDYIIGWQKCVRNDVHYDRYTIFDRYSYDFIVDPIRTKLRLPKAVRKFFVALTPQPRVVFVLAAHPNVIFARKQELTLEEITRQVGEYRKLAATNTKRFILINAEQTPKEMAKQAAEILLNTYTAKL